MTSRTVTRYLAAHMAAEIMERLQLAAEELRRGGIGDLAGVVDNAVLEPDASFGRIDLWGVE